MAELKTKQTRASVEVFLNTIKNEETRQDCYEIVKIMKQATKAEPKMWGPSIIGFGSKPLRYPDGREIDWMVAAFSPRKSYLTLYVLVGFKGQAALLKKLGKHTTGKVCLYIRKLADVDKKVLKEIVFESVKFVNNTN
jgi:hypothetical protein